MLHIDREFVEAYRARYDARFADKTDPRDEQELRNWLANMAEPKYLDWDHFLKLAKWKSPRPERHYEKNDEGLVIEATRISFQASHDKLKLHILMVLEGVSVAVASTILHFLFPDQYPIFDVRTRSALDKAGKWRQGHDPKEDGDIDAWAYYVQVMRGLSKELDVSLRDLDKALFAYDKWPEG